MFEWHFCASNVMLKVRRGRGKGERRERERGREGEGVGEEILRKSEIQDWLGGCR
jgi:hypothetical protein